MEAANSSHQTVVIVTPRTGNQNGSPQHGKANENNSNTDELYFVTPQRHLTATPLRPDAFALTPNEKITRIAHHMESILELLGLDLTDDSIHKTPKRVAKMYVSEVFKGLLPENEPAISRFKAKKFSFENQNNNNNTMPANNFNNSSSSSSHHFSAASSSPSSSMILVRDIDVYSFCEHHLLPFIGKAHVAYVPSDGKLYKSMLKRQERERMRAKNLEEGEQKQKANKSFNHHAAVLAATAAVASSGASSAVVSASSSAVDVTAFISTVPCRGAGAKSSRTPNRTDANDDDDDGGNITCSSDGDDESDTDSESECDEEDATKTKKKKNPSSSPSSLGPKKTSSSTYVLGLSKLNRLVDYYSRRPQVQERLTAQIADAIAAAALTPDVGVFIHAKHYCVACRGVQDRCSSTVTYECLGQFAADNNGVNNTTRSDFFKLVMGTGSEKSR